MNNKKLIGIIAILVVVLTILFIYFLSVAKNKSLENKLKVAILYLQNKDYQSAKKLIEEVLLKDPENKLAIELLKVISGEKTLDEVIGKNQKNISEIKEKIKLAKNYITQKKYLEAEKILQEILKIQPNNKDAIKLLEKIKKLKKEEKEKEKEVEIVVKTSENTEETKKTTTQNNKKTINNKKTNTNINKTKETTKKIDEKEQKFIELVKKGKNEIAQGNYLKGIEYLDEALKIKKSADVYELEGKTYFIIGKENHEYLENAIEKSKKAIEINPDKKTPYKIIADSYYLKEDYDNAEKYYQKLLEKDPSNKDGLEGLLKTKLAKNNNKINEEISHLADKILNIDKNNFLANKVKGIKYYNDKNYSKAIDNFSKAFNSIKSDKEMNIMYAKSLYIKKMYSKVISVLNESLKYNPPYVDEYMLMALSYQKLKNNLLADQYFKSGIKTEKTFDPTYKYKVLYNYGLFLKFNKKYNEAEKMFLKAIEINPDYGIAYEELGVIYLAYLKEYQKAKEAIMQAIQKGRKNYNNYYNLATVYKEIKKFDLAIKYYKLALTENKKITDINRKSDNYAKLYTILGTIIYNNYQDKANDAYILLKKAIQYSSKYAETYTSIIAVAIKLKKYKDKEEIIGFIQKGEKYIKTTISSTLTLNFAKADFYLKAATYLANVKENDKAILYCKNGIKLSPKYGALYDLIIDLLIKEKRYNEAENYINKYLEFANDKKKNELLKLLDKINKLKNS